MLRFLVRRLLFLTVVLLLVSLLTFIIFIKLPSGDPVRSVIRQSTPELYEQVRHNLGLDQPVWIQYWRFAKGMIPWPGFFLHEDVYFSYHSYVPVKEEIARRLPVTLTLAFGGAVLWLLIGISLGVASGRRPQSLVDRAATTFALLGVSLPAFWLAYVLLWVFWFQLGLLPGTGLPPGQPLWVSVVQGRFILPWVTLSISYAAFYSRIVRGNLIEVMDEDFIRTARAKGLTEKRVVYKHGLRAGLTPVLTMLGLDIGLVLGGAVIIEQAFNLPGIGTYLVEAAFNSDFPAVMAVTITASLFIVLMNLVVDILYAVLNPRVRIPS